MNKSDNRTISAKESANSARTTVQDARNRYNELLTQALERIKARKNNKTTQEPEEVTTTATDVTATPTQQPEQVATPEEVTAEYYGYLDGLDPMQRGRIKKQLDRRIYADGKICTWAEYIAEGYEAGQLNAYKDEYTYAKKGRDLAYHEHKVTEWVIWTAHEMERGNGVIANKTIVDYARYLIKLMETPAPEEVTTEEDATPAPATDDATLLRNLIERYGNAGADYLDTLDYSKVTEQAPRTVMFGRAKVTERRYTLPEPNQYGYLSTHGLARYHNRNGKRAEFVVYQYGEAIELRAYGRNNNTYNAEVRFDGGELEYNVTDGLVTRAKLTRDGNTISAEFDDTNRPETPRDLPAPAPTRKPAKETISKETATTVQEQPTSGTATAPTTEEVTAPATEATDDPEEVVFLKGAELNKVIEEYAAITGFDLKEQKRYYTFYATPDGYLAKLAKHKPQKDLQIADEGSYYERYMDGSVTEKDIFFSNNMQSIRRHKQMILYTPEIGRTECDLFVTICSNGEKHIEMPSRPTSPRETAVYEAVHRLYLSDQRTRLERYWKRYGDKVCVNTYWANR